MPLDSYAAIQQMREIGQQDPRNALGFLHHALKHVADSPARFQVSDAMQILADAYDRVYVELFPSPRCTEEMVRDQHNGWLDARANA